MFRLVGFPKEEKEDHKYLKRVASETISDGLKYVYGVGSGEKAPQNFSLIMIMLEYEGFFAGLSQYLPAKTDHEAGWKLMRKKTEKMVEKMEDSVESYTFDVFEEFLFHLAIIRCEEIFHRGRRTCGFYDREKEKAVTKELSERFSYTKRRAGKMAESVVRFHAMGLKEDEEENMFFWDDDYSFVFQYGFVEGIRFLKGFAGERLGYGYDYTCRVFSEVGIKPPLLLLGTKTANRIVNEEMEKRMEEASSSVFGTRLL